MSTHPHDPSNDSDDAARLRRAALLFSRRVRSYRAVDTMSDAQVMALGTLRWGGPHTLRQLAEAMQVSAPSANRTVNCLVDGDYATRTPDENDRRKVVIEITPKGRDVIAETNRKRNAWIESLLAQLAPDERDCMIRAADILLREAAR